MNVRLSRSERWLHRKHSNSVKNLDTKWKYVIFRQQWHIQIGHFLFTSDTVSGMYRTKHIPEWKMGRSVPFIVTLSKIGQSMLTRCRTDTRFRSLLEARFARRIELNDHHLSWACLFHFVFCFPGVLNSLIDNILLKMCLGIIHLAHYRVWKSIFCTFSCSKVDFTVGVDSDTAHFPRIRRLFITTGQNHVRFVRCEFSIQRKRWLIDKNLHFQYESVLSVRNWNDGWNFQFDAVKQGTNLPISCYFIRIFSFFLFSPLQPNFQDSVRQRTQWQ